MALHTHQRYGYIILYKKEKYNVHISCACNETHSTILYRKNLKQLSRRAINVWHVTKQGDTRWTNDQKRTKRPTTLAIFLVATASRKLDPAGLEISKYAWRGREEWSFDHTTMLSCLPIYHFLCYMYDTHQLGSLTNRQARCYTLLPSMHTPRHMCNRKWELVSVCVRCCESLVGKSRSLTAEDGLTRAWKKWRYDLYITSFFGQVYETDKLYGR